MSANLIELPVLSAVRAWYSDGDKNEIDPGGTRPLVLVPPEAHTSMIRAGRTVARCPHTDLLRRVLLHGRDGLATVGPTISRNVFDPLEPRTALV